MIERPDLDGLRLFEPGKPDVWLVFHGRRHRIASSNVYDSLFHEVDGIIESQEIEGVALGDQIGEGACLIRADGTLPVYLLTVFDGEARRCHIPSYEVLRDFGFHEKKVRDASPLLVNAVPIGEALTSAKSREPKPA